LVLILILILNLDLDWLNTLLTAPAGFP